MFADEIKDRLQRAVEIIEAQEDSSSREEVLWMAWGVLQGLSRDQLPEELRPRFEFLSHELSLRKGQEMTSREVAFLLAKIQELEPH
jgi:hypothetical protein